MISGIIQKLYSLLPGIIRRDFLRKTIALFFALLVYFMVTYRSAQEFQMADVAVNISYPEGVVCLDESTPKVILKLKGFSEKKRKQLTPRDFSITLKVEEKKIIVGELYPLKIDISDIKCPVGIRALEVAPSEIMLTLDRNTSKQVKVQARFAKDSSLPEGYTLGNIKLTPLEVSIKGPGTLLKEINTVNTEPIPIDKNTTESFDYSAVIALKSKTISVTPPTVMAQVEVLKEDITMDFRSIPVKMLMPTDDKKLKADFVSASQTDITITGPKNKVKLVKPEQLKAYVDVSSFTEPGVYNVDIGCWIDAPEIKVINIFPSKAQIKLIKSK